MGVSFSTFESFVNARGAVDDNRLVRIETEASPTVNSGADAVISWLSVKNVETDKIRTSLFQSRSAEQQTVNNTIRNAFKAEKAEMATRTETKTLVDAGRIINVQAYNLNTAYTGQKRSDAAAVLSLIDLEPRFADSVFGSALLALLPGVLDKLANRQPPGTPITRTMLCQAMGIGNLPPGLEDLSRDQFSQTLADRLQARMMADSQNIPAEKYGPDGVKPSSFGKLYNALAAGLKYESAVDILTSPDREIKISDFVVPPVVGNAINNPSDPGTLLKECRGTLVRDLPRVKNIACTFEDNLLFDLEVEGKGRQLRGMDEKAVTPFVDYMTSKINEIALQKRGRTLSDREMAGLLGCLAQQGANLLSALDVEVFHANQSNRELSFSFDDAGRITVSIKPRHSDRFARDYEIKATIHEDGTCIVDSLQVSKRLRPVS